MAKRRPARAGARRAASAPQSDVATPARSGKRPKPPQSASARSRPPRKKAAASRRKTEQGAAAAPKAARRPAKAALRPRRRRRAKRAAGKPAAAARSAARSTAPARTLDEIGPDPALLPRHGPPRRRRPAPAAPKCRERSRDHRGHDPDLTAGDVDADARTPISAATRRRAATTRRPTRTSSTRSARRSASNTRTTRSCRASDKIAERDRHRWELDPASSEDYKEQEIGTRRLRAGGLRLTSSESTAWLLSLD